MYVLGIETSCDETAASVVKDGSNICSNVVSSSLKFHQKYGGIVPEIASRMQLETIVEVVDCALRDSGVRLKDIGLVSVTSGPGLLGSLLVGISFAKSLSLSRNIPILGVSHLYSHIYANFLEGVRVKFPFIALIVSGGHTSLYYVKDFNRMEILGSTQDDACGEAFDKVAKILGLGYPGGPVIERLAKKGDCKKIKFNCSNTNRQLDFSFSGIKTAVYYYVRKQSTVPACRQGRDRGLICDIAASFQDAVINTLIKKSLIACAIKKAKILVVGGGVAANNTLRARFYQQARERNIACLFPSKSLCMDNAAMVAGLGYRLFKKGYSSDLNLNAELDFSLH
jgi:N6-L-threonylcarbamoyladenine synthase